jgi:hypothetical protein
MAKKSQMMSSFKKIGKKYISKESRDKNEDKNFRVETIEVYI